MANTDDGLSWILTDPANTDARSAGAQEIRANRKSMAIRLDKEHAALTTATSDPALASGGGEHKPGSAVAYRDDTAPTDRPDGATTLTAAVDEGRLWVDSTGATEVLKVYNDSDAWVAVSGVSKISGNFDSTVLNSSQITATVGFVPDIFFCNVNGLTFIALLMEIDPHVNVTASTAENKYVLNIGVSGTDVTIDKVSGNAFSGTAYWVALAY